MSSSEHQQGVRVPLHSYPWHGACSNLPTPLLRNTRWSRIYQHRECDEAMIRASTCRASSWRGGKGQQSQDRSAAAAVADGAREVVEGVKGASQSTRDRDDSSVVDCDRCEEESSTNSKKVKNERARCRPQCPGPLFPSVVPCPRPLHGACIISRLPSTNWLRVGTACTVSLALRRPRRAQRPPSLLASRTALPRGPTVRRGCGCRREKVPVFQEFLGQMR